MEQNPKPQQNEGNQVDLFDRYDLMPEVLTNALDEWYRIEEISPGDAPFEYAQLNTLLKILEPIGYMFDYGLDGEPYGLCPIGVRLSELDGFEEEDEMCEAF